ncbi:hypothetical protein LMH87_004932 [Akanthomyces muscarius]|uniref:Zn(2)-C6 fungal-type domain-containing protein n=1 Tax=Akanthomyces muscarius TaxID=2231603 RepID=A0A9W8QJQ2_AKAMU|nr:hypothetical protein LMH87_004932 [Akanthomyces muscarius]KAJ4163188.1 hypothetical protein LMH87_004932 [Akanthomyces muscarius]
MESRTGPQAQSNFRGEERPVVIRACDTCRTKKIRCEPTTQGCSQCTKRGTRCHFTPIAMKRKRRRPAGFKYIAQLEKRLIEVEAMVEDRPLGKPTVPNISSHIEQTTLAASPSTTALIKSTNGMNAWMLESEPRMLSPEQTSNLQFNFGVFPLYDHNQPDLSTLRGHITDYVWPLPAPELCSGSPPTIQPLPTKAVALELIEETFRNYNRFLPLFDEEDFFKEFQLKYSTSNPTDAAWWACLNVVLSIAHRLRAIPMLDPTQENILAFGHAQSALSVVSKLTVSNHSLSAVQALAGMACVLQGTPNPEPAAMLVAAALRLAQAMNLHRECTSLEITEMQAEKRRRVFWKVYILDKDISLRTGRPFGQDDDDMDLELPEDCNLSSGLQLSGEMIHKVVLRLTYIHCLAMIDRHLPPTAPPSYNQDLSLPEALLPSSNVCVVESRKAIRLVEAIPQGDCACVWMLIHAFFAAASSVLSSLAQNPMSPNAISDLALVKPFLRLLETLAEDPSTLSQSDELFERFSVLHMIN